MRELYGQSDGAGKACSRSHASAGAAGAPAEIATQRLCLPVFSTMPRGNDKAGHARSVQIDPIQVWINAERILMDAQQKAAGPESRSSLISND
ncbi:hypothetical protein [Bradyrhizobium sp. CCBAU 51627]|uniref:hypothetical protein n=1 Tax=Bradyrhizobium sp. CCBAU 51627 TaxID=1325088 RepID=UPI0023052F1A|nr:hypothetical protein [Bradyrhizobium sp. CCBAU 51627]